MDTATLETPIGKIDIVIDKNHVVKLTLNSEKEPNNTKGKSGLINAVTQQIKTYFLNPQFEFDVPLRLTGTHFQLKVWRALTKIPRGTTYTYGELANKLNTHARAIGNACRNNPIPLIIPCHRIVAQGSIGGFSGETEGHNIKIKQLLLKHEAKTLHSDSYSPLELREVE